MDITFRPAIAEDIEWLDPFYESLMRPYVELTHEWNPTLFREKFDPAHASIIQLNGVDIGYLKYEKREDHIYLGDIQVKTEYQGKGIGTQVLQHVIQEAQEQHLPIRLRVLKGNPAIDLYKRLGFEEYPEELEHSIALILPHNAD